MKFSIKTGALVTAVLALVIGLASCEAFTPDALALGGKTYTYVQGNGHDKDTYVFDSTGKAGTYTKETYSYDYTTTGAITADVVSAKTWFQTGGEKGTFTYDPATFDLSIVKTQVWARTAGSTTMANGKYTAYGWQTLLEKENRSAVLYTAVSATASYKLVFTMDNAESDYGYFGTIWVFTSGNTWGWNKTTTNSYTSLNGSVSTTTIVDTNTIDISATSYNTNKKTVTTQVVAGVTTKTTTVSKEVATVSKFTLVREAGDNPVFDQSFVDGKTVTFYYDRTQSDEYSYTGDTVPTAPTSFIGGVAYLNSNTSSWITPYYKIDKNQSGSSVTFEHHGKYLLPKLVGAGRGL